MTFTEIALLVAEYGARKAWSALRDALKTASPVEAIIINRLIGMASQLEQQTAELTEAHRAKAKGE